MRFSGFVASRLLFTSKRRVVLAALLVCGNCGSAGADDGSAKLLTVDTVNITGESFLHTLSSGPEGREKAEIYMLAISDAAEGRIWCDHKSFKTLTLREFVFGYLRKLPLARQREKAAPLIEEALRASFPCGKSK